MMNQQMEELLQKKQIQLEKAIERYNADNHELNQMKAKYENFMKKLQIQQREVEAMKKRGQEEIEKAKEEEMQKLRKEK